MPKYHRPTTRADALAALAEGGERARALVGGTDLLVGLRHHHDTADVLVDLKGVTDLPDPIVVTDDGVQIGPTYTMGELVTHPVDRRVVPGAGRGRAHRRVGGHPQPGQPGRELVQRLPGRRHRSPAARARRPGDHRLPGRRPDGVAGRVLPRPAPDAVRARRAGRPGSTCPGPPRAPPRAFRRLTRRRGVDLATVSVAAGVGPDGGLVLGMGAVGPRPLRTAVPGPVDLTDGASLDRALDQLLSVATPITDVRGSREYRLATLRVLDQARGPRCGGPPGPQGDGLVTSTHVPDHLDDDELQTVTLTVNGSERTVAVPTHRTLLDGLRDEVGLPGTKSCCAEGECGACTVLLDGKAVNSCLVLCVEAEGTR